MFSLLQAATYVDIDTGNAHMSAPIAVPSLFPQAKHIRLGGIMHYVLASAILHGTNKAPLQSLELNNVQDGGLLVSGANFSWLGLSELGRSIYPEEIWPEGSLPVQVAPGPMRRLLTSKLQLRCANLQILSLQKQGQQIDRYPPSDLNFDEDVYKEWASFIGNVRPPFIAFSHLGRDEWPYNGSEEPIRRGSWGHPPITLPDVAPMDLKFQRILWPLLKKGWPGLQVVSIHGVSKGVMGNINSLGGHLVVVDEKLDCCVNGVVGAEWTYELPRDRFVGKVVGLISRISPDFKISKEASKSNDTDYNQL